MSMEFVRVSARRALTDLGELYLVGAAYVLLVVVRYSFDGYKRYKL